MTRQAAKIARTAWSKVQSLAVLALCIGTGTVLPLSLAIAGLPTV